MGTCSYFDAETCFGCMPCFCQCGWRDVAGSRGVTGVAWHGEQFVPRVTQSHSTLWMTSCTHQHVTTDIKQAIRSCSIVTSQQPATKGNQSLCDVILAMAQDQSETTNCTFSEHRRERNNVCAQALSRAMSTGSRVPPRQSTYHPHVGARPTSPAMTHAPSACARPPAPYTQLHHPRFLV